MRWAPSQFVLPQQIVQTLADIVPNGPSQRPAPLGFADALSHPPVGIYPPQPTRRAFKPGSHKLLSGLKATQAFFKKKI